MALKLLGGSYALTPQGLPQEISGLELLLQNVSMLLNLKLGAFPYGRELGSRLYTLDLADPHLKERALSLANEALLSLPGVRAKSAEILEKEIKFEIASPLGDGEVRYETEE